MLDLWAEHERVHGHVLAHGAAALTAVAFDAPARAAIAQVGSSRAYLFRDGRGRLLAADHALATMLVAEGRRHDEHPQSWRVVTRLLGFQEGNASRCPVLTAQSDHVLVAG
jgi:serine/threonine protein phosphatase PrpC